MRILAVSDTVVDRIYSPNVAEYVRNIDLVLGCGDLPYEYRSYTSRAITTRIFRKGIRVPGRKGANIWIVNSCRLRV
jgi:predicted phosphodiesterase